MKTYHYLSVLVFALAMFSCGSTKPLSAEQQAKEEKISELVANKDFTVEVTQAAPMRGRNIHLTSMYDIKIRNDSVYAYLPYFGVAHYAPYGGGEGGIKFATTSEDYKLSPAKDGWDIRFRVKAKEYHYDISLNIFKNGSSVLYVSSYQQDPITFYGNLVME